MKNLLTMLAFGLSTTGMAGTLNELDHATILKALTDGTARANEIRSFYYAGKNGSLIQVDNNEKSMSVSVTPAGASARGLAANFYTQDTVETTVVRLGNTTVATLTNYVVVNSSREVYSTTELKIADPAPSSKKLSVVITDTSYYSYHYDDRVDGSVLMKLKTPKIEMAAGSAALVLSLSANENEALGKEAIQKVGDQREGGTGSCTLKSATELACGYSLETDYADDTVHAKFLIENGQVSKLVDAYLEPGC